MFFSKRIATVSLLTVSLLAIALTRNANTRLILALAIPKVVRMPVSNKKREAPLF